MCVSFHFSLVQANVLLQAKDEEISLGREEAPRIVCDQSFTVYDIDGNPHEFTPEFHVCVEVSMSFNNH